MRTPLLLILLLACSGAPERSYTDTVVVDAVRSGKGAVERCYTEQLRQDPELTGKVFMLFDVARDGHAQNIRVDEQASALKDEAMRGCIITAIGKWTFPTHEGEPKPVRFPFVFGGVE